MSTRRRNAYRKSKGLIQEPKVREEQLEEPIPVKTSGHHRAGAAVEGERPIMEGYLPVAVVMEILADEYSGSPESDPLCRVALRVAEESGAITKYRPIWNDEENSQSGPLSSLLFDRNQTLELIKYYERKGNMEALRKEREKLRLIEGRLLLGGVPQTKVTGEDIEKLEQFIKECGF